jgi:PAS domain S-box-containing protein
MNQTPKSQSLSERFQAGIVATAVVVCSVGMFLMFDLYRSHQSGRKSYMDAIRGMELIGQLQYQMQEARRIMLYSLATADSNKQVEYADQSRAADLQAAKTLTESARLMTSPDERQAVQQLEKNWKLYLELRDALIASMLEGNPATAVERDTREGLPAFNTVRNDLQTVEGLFRSKAYRLLAEADVSFRDSLLRLFFILILTVALAGLAIKTIQKSSLLAVLTASEARLRYSRQKFETLVNSIDGVVWEADPKTFRFTFVSEQAVGLLGYSTEQWMDIPNFWSERLHPADRDRAIARRLEAVVKQQPSRIEYRMMALDGREIWIHESASVITEGDSPVLLRGVLIDVTDQKTAGHKLKLLHDQLLDTSRRAGMAEVATGVLHNVGNVLNSVNVSAILLRDVLRSSKVSALVRAVSLFREHAGNLQQFLFDDPKGKVLPEYLTDVTGHLEKERQKLSSEAERLAENVAHIKDIVAMQQAYAKVSGVTETLQVADLIEDALQINAAGFARHGVKIVREFQDVPPVIVDRHKMLQILVNLASNAKYALDSTDSPEKRLVLGVVRNGDNKITITFADNGVGIAPENLTRIFSHGFTTKPHGHGFGLHSAALAAKEMGGSLIAYSDGVGRGATFTLELPMSKEGC